MQRLVIMLAALSLGAGATAVYEWRGIGALTVAEYEEATSGDACATTVQAQDKARDPEQLRAEFKAAGVCARCHVISVLEWGISGHFTADTGTDCKSCHGPSAGHVANER